MYTPLFRFPRPSSKLDSSVIKTLERLFFTLSECLFNVLIIGEYNLDETVIKVINNSHTALIRV